MSRLRHIRRMWWTVAPPSELRVVYGQIARWRVALDEVAPVPPDAIASARLMARMYDDVPALIRGGRPPSGVALVLLQSAVEQPLILGVGFSYRGRLSPRGRQYHDAWLEITRIMVEEGELTADEHTEALSDMRDLLKSRG